MEPSVLYGVYFMIEAILSWSKVKGMIASLGCTRTWDILIIIFLISLPPDALVGLEDGWSFEDLAILLFNILAVSYPSDLQRVGRLFKQYSMFTTFKLIAPAMRDICSNSHGFLVFLRDIRIVAYMFLVFFIATLWPLLLAALSHWLLMYLFPGIIAKVISYIFSILCRAMSIHRVFTVVCKCDR
jgi:hypothetical protein